MNLKVEYDKLIDETDWIKFVKGLLRMWPAWIVTFILLVFIYVIAPQQLPLLAYKTAFITWAGIIGYWLYRWVDYEEDDVGTIHKRYRRCAFVAAAIIGFALAA